VRLTLHSGLAAGALVEVHLGGRRGRWEYLVAGPAIANMGAALELARSGEAVVHADAWRRIEGRCRGTPVGDAGHARLESAVEGASEARVDVTDELASLVSPRACEQTLSAYAPRIVLAALNAGRYSMLGELRLVRRAPTLPLLLPPSLTRTPRRLPSSSSACLTCTSTRPPTSPPRSAPSARYRTRSTVTTVCCGS
jgi:hypothetical protein